MRFCRCDSDLVCPHCKDVKTHYWHTDLWLLLIDWSQLPGLFFLFPLLSALSQTVRSEFDSAPEFLKQSLTTRKHKHLHSASNGERMCRCVKGKTEGGQKERAGGNLSFSAKQSGLLWWWEALTHQTGGRESVVQTRRSVIYYHHPVFHMYFFQGYRISLCLPGYTSGTGDYREKEGMYDEIIRLKKVKRIT